MPCDVTYAACCIGSAMLDLPAPYTRLPPLCSCRNISPFGSRASIDIGERAFSSVAGAHHKPRAASMDVGSSIDMPWAGGHAPRAKANMHNAHLAVAEESGAGYNANLMRDARPTGLLHASLPADEDQAGEERCVCPHAHASPWPEAPACGSGLKAQCSLRSASISQMACIGAQALPPNSPPAFTMLPHLTLQLSSPCQDSPSSPHQTTPSRNRFPTCLPAAAARILSTQPQGRILGCAMLPSAS